MTAAPLAGARRHPRVAAAVLTLGVAAVPAGLAAPAGAATSAAHRVATSHLPARTIVARAKKSAAHARALALVGTLRQGRAVSRFSVATGAHGANAHGNVTSRSASLGFTGRLDFVERGSVVYLRAPVTFWRAQLGRPGTGVSGGARTRVAHVLAGRWVEVTGITARRMRAGLGSLTSPASFVRTLLSPASLGTLHKSRTVHFHHHLAVAITAAKGGTVYVAATGAPRPLAVVARARTGGGTVVFGYPKGVVVHPPRGSQTLAHLVTTARS